VELKEGSKGMVAPRVVTWDQVRVMGKQIPSLITIGEMTHGGDLKGLGREIQILLVLQVPQDGSKLE